jgi:cytochrome d ubiquinol oxidase subunit II
MHLYDIPMIFVLAGLTLYSVLGGADFGAGIWQMLAGRGEAGARIREHAHHSMAPVWEANHVWLIFVLTVTWTAYPVAFGSIASTLSVPLFLAAIGIVLRGAAYALRSGARTPRETRRIDTLFAASSVLTPFMLGTCIGAIAARRVPVGNAAGPLLSSWTGPTSILIGVIALLAFAYLAAVYLAGDAIRGGHPELAEAFRRRALAAGLLTGAASVAGLIVIHGDAHPLYHGLTHGNGIVALIVSVAAGLIALTLVGAGRYEPARFIAALAVAAIVLGWALAQQPVLLPHLTIAQAAAPHDALVLVIVAVLAGGVILFPSLGLLFRLFLSGGFDPEDQSGAADTSGLAGPPPGPVRALAAAPGRPGIGRIAVACFVAALLLLVFVDAWWGQLIGVLSAFAAIILGFTAVGPVTLAESADRPASGERLPQ